MSTPASGVIQHLSIQRRYLCHHTSYLLLLLALTAAVMQPAYAVDLDGDIRTPDDSPICAMVLASGQFMFSCSPHGLFDLNGLPREPDGTIKRQIYADGFFPRIDILPDSTSDKVVLTRSGSCPSYNPPSDHGSFPNAAGERVTISGKILLQDTQTPVCALVLANGQHMFSCDGTGSYALNIPLNANGQYKLQVFADGFAPTVLRYDQFSTKNDVRLARAGECETFPEDNTVARVEVTPTTLLLSSIGDKQALSAQAYNAAGEAITADVKWSSNDAATVSIGGDGQVKAEDTVGSALITATVGGIESPPILALVAVPAINSILVSDDQFVDDPDPVDPNAEFGIGYRYRVTVTDDVGPEIGDILIASGSKPVAGQVADVTDNGDGTVLVVLEFVSINQVFTELVIDEEFHLTNSPIEIEDEFAEFYDVSVDEDGTYVFEPIPGKAITDGSVIQGHDQAAPLKLLDQTASLTATGGGLSQLQAEDTPQAARFGPYECKFTGDFPLKVTPGLPRFYFSPALYFVLHRNTLTDRTEELGVRGSFVGGIHIDLSTQVAVQAKLECKAKIFKFVVPLNGALAAYISPVITMEGGFALGGKLEVTQADLTLSGSVTGDGIDMGVLCPFGLVTECTFITEGTADISADPPLIEFPNDYISGDVTPFFQGFVTPGLEVGPALALGRISFGIVEFKVGPKVSFDLDTVTEQIRRNKFSLFTLDIEGEIGPKTDASRTLNFLRTVLDLKPVTPKVKIFDLEWDRSPVSDLFVANDSLLLEIGDDVTFKLSIQSGTESFGLNSGLTYGIGTVNVYHVANTANPSPVRIASAVPVSNTQTQFDIPWTVDRTGGDFFATVESEELKILAPFGLDELVLARLDKPEVTPIFPLINGEQYVGVSVHMAGSLDPIEGAIVQFTPSHAEISLDVLSGTVDEQGEFSSRLICLVDEEECSALYDEAPYPSFDVLVTLLNGREFELTIEIGG